MFAVVGKKVAGNALLVVILEEVEHMFAQGVGCLPLTSDVAGLLFAFRHSAQAIIHSHLVIEIVEVALLNVVGIGIGVVYLGNEDDARMLGLDLCDSPFPELHRHHLGHIATP